ncbi:MAG TPA: cytochrome c [Opitutaceae bacterium]|nr:cytochrome c [Opitutaceae bacterium]
MKRTMISVAALVLAGLAGCDNMGHQRGAERSGGPEGNRAAARPTPAGTVARGAPAPGDPAVTGFRDGQPLATMPVTPTPARIERGRDRFNIYCAACHGEDGYGRGIVVRRGFPAPPSYHEDRLRQAPDGHLFDVMTRGYGAMLPFADRLTADDRWAVVAYIRALQRSQHVALRDLPPGDRAHFSSP